MPFKVKKYVQKCGRSTSRKIMQFLCSRGATRNLIRGGELENGNFL